MHQWFISFDKAAYKITGSTKVLTPWELGVRLNTQILLCPMPDDFIPQLGASRGRSHVLWVNWGRPGGGVPCFMSQLGASRGRSHVLFLNWGRPRGGPMLYESIGGVPGEVPCFMSQLGASRGRSHVLWVNWGRPGGGPMFYESIGGVPGEGSHVLWVNWGRPGAGPMFYESIGGVPGEVPCFMSQLGASQGRSHVLWVLILFPNLGNLVT